MAALTGWSRADKGSFALTPPDLPFGFQHRQRPPDGPATEAKIGGQVPLGRQCPVREGSMLRDHLPQGIQR